MSLKVPELHVPERTPLLDAVHGGSLYLIPAKGDKGIVCCCGEEIVTLADGMRASSQNALKALLDERVTAHLLEKHAPPPPPEPAYTLEFSS